MKLRLDPDFICDARQLSIRVTECGVTAGRKWLRYLRDLQWIIHQFIGECRDLAKRVRKCDNAEAAIVTNRHRVARGSDNLGHENIARVRTRTVAEIENLVQAIRQTLFVAGRTSAQDQSL